jgi:Raf kinase inhibitor-like YbhB/YbcL family protein
VKSFSMRRVSLLVVTVLTMAVVIARVAHAHETWLSRAFGLFTPRAADPRAAGSAERALHVNSKTISPGGEFPKRETCDGEDTSPPLAWSTPPAPAIRSFVLLLDDPDAPGGTFTHWLLWDIPGGAREVPQALPASPRISGGATQGRNDFAKIGYSGPCPPPGKSHRYFFRLYALDVVLGLKPGASRLQLERAMQDHVVARDELMGRYRR